MSEWRGARAVQAGEGERLTGLRGGGTPPRCKCSHAAASARHRRKREAAAPSALLNNTSHKNSYNVYFESTLALRMQSAACTYSYQIALSGVSVRTQHHC